MKYLMLILAFSFSVLVRGQQDSITLKKYCPTAEGQDGALCFAYAPVYTALSIEYNHAYNQTNEDSGSFKKFSYGFVASKVKKDKSFFGRLFNRCGRDATVDLALGVLLETGTVEYSDFPQKCDCGEVDPNIEKAKKYKIKDTIKIGSSETIPSTHIQNIKAALEKNKPVIIAILQEDFFHDSNGKYSVDFPDNYQQNTLSANHVICIVGFNNAINGGSFLVKNNYKIWGQNGFSYVKYEDLIKLIRASYILDI